ncbi:MAG: amino acid adenylation domain-containing protein [Smithella sp.]|jgi:D-alanine--poly(phosphoribitol) ligase subunit 1
MMQINTLEYFERGALLKCPEKVAVIDGDRAFTFKDLEINAKKLAKRIVQKNNIYNNPIAVFLPKNVHTIIANLGILYSGNFYFNLDIKSPTQRLSNIINHIKPATIVTSEQLKDSLIKIGVDKDCLIIADENINREIAYDNEMLMRRLDKIIDTDPVCLINTSGSTGTPKGVVMHHRSVIDFIDWVNATFQFNETDIIGSLSPFYFDIYTLELYISLSRGTAIAIIPEQHAAFPIRLLEYLKEKNVSFIFWVPTIMVNIANMDLLSKMPLDSLKIIFFAGEVFPMKQLNYWRRKIPKATFVNLYGPIEIAVDCTFFIMNREFGDSDPLPIGFPCRNTNILILNDHNKPVEINEPGELCVRGSSLALGYWNDPEKTAKAFVQNPLNTYYPELIYRTGDIVFVNELGEIMFLGRKDYQIKHLGYRIELSEIEHVIGSMADIDNSCVLYHRQKKEITLFYESTKPINTADIRQHVMQILPKYMVPTIFHQLDAMPRNPNGKIDRQKLAEMYLG